MADGRESSFLTQAYGGYHASRSTDIDDDLVRVGRGTPGGEYLRRFWQPVCVADELGDRPLAIHILGEDMVVFRDGGGRVGLLDRRCCHRGASLEFGKIKDRGIQCCYHGWHFDVDGRLIEAPAEARGNSLEGRLHQGAYPVEERYGFVFAYMGPPEARPPLPLYDGLERPGTRLMSYKLHSPCNWFQIRENDLDTAHGKYLHTDVHGVQVTACYSAEPYCEWVETPIGILSVSARRWKDNIFIRCTDFIWPNLGRLSALEDAEGESFFDRRGGMMAWCVPIDDTNSYEFKTFEIEEHLPDPARNGLIDRQARAGVEPTMFEIGQDGDRPYTERQQAPGDWDAWVSQGPISHRGRDNLATSDKGVVMLRRLIRQGIRDVREGRDPKGLVREAGAPVRTYANSIVAPLAKGATEEEDRAAVIAYTRDAVDRIVSGRMHEEVSGFRELAAEGAAAE